MRRYETIFITHPDLSEEDQTELLGKIRTLMVNLKTDMIRMDDWGLKRLSYAVRKNSRGHYYLMDYLAGPDVVHELERTLRLNDRILKFQTVKLSAEVTPEAVQTLKEGILPTKAPEVVGPGAPLANPTEEQGEPKIVESEGGEEK